MELRIKKNIDNEIIVSLTPKINLVISDKNEEFTHEKINEFLIKIAASIPEGEKLEIIQEFENNNSEDKTFSHIVFLFEEFAKNFNSED